jgi:hypothetical protein
MGGAQWDTPVGHSTKWTLVNESEISQSGHLGAVHKVDTAGAVGHFTKWTRGMAEIFG